MSLIKQNLSDSDCNDIVPYGLWMLVVTDFIFEIFLSDNSQF